MLSHLKYAPYEYLMSEEKETNCHLSFNSVITKMAVREFRAPMKTTSMIPKLQVLPETATSMLRVPQNGEQNINTDKYVS